MKIANIISTINNPPIICIPLFLIISLILADGDINKFLILEAISIIFATVLPLAIILGWARKLGTDKDISNRTDRFVPMIVGVVSYFIGFLVSLLLGVDIFMSILLLCYTVNTFIMMLITTRWKISIHTTGLSGPVGALIVLVGFWGALIGLMYPILIWSRVTLKKHTLAQAIAGGALGFFLTVIDIFLILNVFNIHLTYIQPFGDIIWLVLAIVLTPIVLGILSYINLNSRKIIFYLTQAIFIACFLVFAPFDAFIMLILIICVCILISHLAGEDYCWNSVLKK